MSQLNEIIQERVYSIVSIDLDYFIRYCIRFDGATISAIARRVWSFLQRYFGKYIYQPDLLDDFYYILLLNVDCESAKQYVSSVRRDFRKQRFMSSLDCRYEYARLDFSAGVASFPQHGDDLEEVCRMSCVALNQAKAMRRGRIIVAPNKEVSPNREIKYYGRSRFSVLLGKYGARGICPVSPTPYERVLLDEPQAIAMQGENLFIADQNNHCIILCRSGYACRIAGCGRFGYSGDGALALEACLNKPTGICIQGSELYITDTGNDVVRKVSLDTGIIETIAGCHEPGYSGDGGKANVARLNKPGGIDIDAEGNLFINDIANNVVRMVNTSGIISTYAGTGEYGDGGDEGIATKACFREIYGLCVDRQNGDLYLADYFNNRIRKIDRRTGVICTVVGTGESGYGGDGKLPREARLKCPVSVYVDCYGNIYWTESGNSCVRFFCQKENAVYTIGGTGTYGVEQLDIGEECFSLANPNAITVNEDGEIFVIEGSSNRLCKITIERRNEYEKRKY